MDKIINITRFEVIASNENGIGRELVQYFNAKSNNKQVLCVLRRKVNNGRIDEKHIEIHIFIGNATNIYDYIYVDDFNTFANKFMRLNDTKYSYSLSEIYGKCTSIYVTYEDSCLQLQTYENNNVENFEFYVQDDNRTLKLFINEKQKADEKCKNSNPDDMYENCNC